MKPTNLWSALLLGGAIMLTPINGVCASQSEQSAREKINQLQQLIKKAEAKGIDTQREECAVRWASDFLVYAAWDEENVALNRDQYISWAEYSNNGDDVDALAERLPEYERKEVNLMLDEAIDQIEDVLSGKIKRPNAPMTDWGKISIEGDRYLSDGETRFLNYNMIWGDSKMKNYYNGIVGGAGLSINMMESQKGVSKKSLKELKNLPDVYSGDIFLGHSAPPQWMRDLDPTVEDGARMFVRYDIDNPLIRKSWSKVIESVVPLYADKKATDWGYILSNEPQWNLVKDEWQGFDISEHSMEKFRVWLKNRHKDIARLNELWGTSFASFEQVDVELPFDKSLYGTPMIYDVTRFNMDRVTEWFTFLASSIKAQDSDAKVNVKLMPHLFGHDRRDHGLDFEQILALSDIIGNDAKAVGRSVFSKHPEHWEENYIVDWNDVGISYDFMHSVAPNATNLNSEAHFLSTVSFRDHDLQPEYVRANYWLATMQGMDGAFTWFWARREDGSIHPSLRAGVEQTDNAMSKAYAASLAQQPRVVNELGRVYLDMNCFAEELTAIQRLRRPIRLYYSEVTPSVSLDYMHRMMDIYTPLFFSGSPVGFATERVIETQDNDNWDVIAVYNTPFVAESEIDALQGYLDRGGKVIIDNISLKLNEYGEAHTKSLKPSNGELIYRSSTDTFIAEATQIAEDAGSLPAVCIEERNDCPSEGCLWRAIETKEQGSIMSVVNIGASDATLNITMRDGSTIKQMTNMLTGEKIENGFKMQPYDVLMIEIAK